VCLLDGECSKTATMAKRLFYDLHASAGLFAKFVGSERLSGDCDTPDALKQAWYIEYPMRTATHATVPASIYVNGDSRG
jgi:hypothetical protein